MSQARRYPAIQRILRTTKPVRHLYLYTCLSVSFATRCIVGECSSMVAVDCVCGIESSDVNGSSRSATPRKESDMRPRITLRTLGIAFLLAAAALLFGGTSTGMISPHVVQAQSA